MSSVIGSGAYFGGFNSNPVTSSSEVQPKGSNYGNISSESYKYAPSSSGKGMTFGESVMRELQEKKKPVTTSNPT